MCSCEIVDIFKKKIIAVSSAVLESDKMHHRQTFLACSKNGTLRFEDTCLKELVI